MIRIFLLLYVASSLSFGATVQVINAFATFPAGAVADIGDQSQFGLPLGGDNIVGPFTVGGVTISSGNAPSVNGFFFASGSTGSAGLSNSANIPGNDAGAIVSNSPFFQMQLPDLVVNFSQPIAGFGATFIHQSSGQPMLVSATGPASISVFTGLNGTGTLLGTVADTGGANALDFIGLLSDSPNIQSAVISSSSLFGTFELDAFGLSAGAVQAVPEPGAMSLIAIGLVLFVLRAALRKRSAISVGHAYTT